MLSRGLIDPTDLVTHTFSLNQWEMAFNAARHPDSIKVVLEH
jgi:threonine dehydrogenase-like Zn-dependent dehydrogenase